MAVKYPDFEERLYLNFKARPISELECLLTTKELTSDQRSFFIEFAELARMTCYEDFLTALKKANLDRPLFHFAYLDRTDAESELRISAQSKLKELLSGRRVVLVGPSITVQGTGYGPEIENYDLVVRVNFQWPIPSFLIPDLGRRVDILYHCCNGDRPILRILKHPEFSDTKFVCYERGLESLHLRNHCRESGIPSLPISDSYRTLTDKLKTAPNTGTVAINHLLQFPIKELFVVGFTFFQDPYYEGYPGDGADPSHWTPLGAPVKIWEHKFRPQLEYFRSLYKADKRIRVDRRLRDILSWESSSPKF